MNISNTKMFYCKIKALKNNVLYYLIDRKIDCKNCKEKCVWSWNDGKEEGETKL